MDTPTTDQKNTLCHFDPIAYINNTKWQGVELGLERINYLMDRLHSPQDQIPSIHIAGTNGKGSVAAFCAEILKQAGYKVGLFTSPQIFDFKERIKVNDVAISENDFCQCTIEVGKIADRMDNHPSEFEMITAIAFLYFYQQNCDINVIEVGLGGRLDSTNCITRPIVEAITPISFDHSDTLGSTIEKIAQEKAGIIKNNVCLVSAQQKESVKKILLKKFQQLNDLDKSSLTFVDPSKIVGTNMSFSYKNHKNLQLQLAGIYQKENAALACEIVDVLTTHGFTIEESHIQKGLLQTAWPGRFQIIKSKTAKFPTFIVDGSHNNAGIDSLIQSLKAVFPNKKIIFVVGMLADKTYTTMIDKLIAYALEIKGSFITVSPNNPRALSAQMLADCIDSLKDKYPQQKKEMKNFVQTAQNIHEALNSALKLTHLDMVSSGRFDKDSSKKINGIYNPKNSSNHKNTIICCCGSLYLVRDFINSINLLINES